MTPPDDDLSRLIAGLRSGDPQVLLEFWNRYQPQLERVAQRHLAPGMERRFGAEDVVQSVCRTFFRRMQGGEFQLGDADGLWRLLCAITLTKLREKARFHQRAKRGVQHETAPAEDAGDVFGPAAAGPQPDEAAEFADLLDILLSSLDDEERQVVQLKLQECTHEEVAEKLGLSERTIRRVLKRVQARLEEALGP